MKRSRTILRAAILGVIFIGIAVALYNAFIKDKAVVQVGQPAPDFVLPTLEGEKFQLSEYEGQGVVLNFWGTWCEPCEAEMPDLNRAYNTFKDRGVTVIALNIGESDVTVNAFRDRHQLDFPIVMDRRREITQLYQIVPIPTTFFIDENGVVRNIIKNQMSEQTIMSNMQQIMPESR